MLGPILQGSFDLYRRFFKHFVVIAAAVFVVLDLVAAIADLATRRGTGLSAFFWNIVSAVLWLIGSFWVQGALVEAVQDVRDGRVDVEVGQLFQRVQPRLGALLVAGILSGLGIALGFVLFILPGFYLLTQWVLLVPVIVIERKAVFDAFGRSHQLVRGHGWPTFGLIAITLVASGILQGILVGLFSWLPRFASVWIGGLIAHSLVVPWVAIAWTMLYYRLVEERRPAVTAPAVPPPPTTPPIPVG